MPLLRSVRIHTHVLQLGSQSGDISLKVCAYDVDLVIGVLDIGFHEDTRALDLNPASLSCLAELTSVLLSQLLLLSVFDLELADQLLQLSVFVLGVIEHELQLHALPLLRLEPFQLLLKPLPSPRLSS